MLIALKVFGSMQKSINKLVPQTYDEKFALHLKETELRKNNKELNLYKILLKLINIQTCHKQQKKGNSLIHPTFFAALQEVW
jgi:hypothetical protein